jgi:NADPH:quinone reductase-like Zn-dependent oxidoreductase
MPGAIFVTRRGGPEVLADREVPEPVPGPGEVVIGVEAAGVNFADLLGRMGLYPEAPPIPFVPGYEVAGMVTAIGEGVTEPAAGARVLALTKFAGCAESAVTLASMTFPIPDHVPFDEAAAFPVNFATADLALFRVGAPRDGERVLIRSGRGSGRLGP